MEISELHQAILAAVAYADVFSHPLTVEEMHRYLVGLRASLEQVQSVFESDRLLPHVLQYQNGYVTLRGRQELITLRSARTTCCARIWPRAAWYGRLISRLPFVRMVAVTGALAMDNEPEQDIDYLVVVESGRLWTIRGLVMLLVRWARKSGVEICPNYFISETALCLKERSLYTAHELAQMVPLSGMDVYWKMRSLNRWVLDYLPNAEGLPENWHRLTQSGNYIEPQAAGSSGIIEYLLRTPIINSIESWEMHRKIEKFARFYPYSPEADFSADWCKGHYGYYGLRTQQAYTERLVMLGFSPAVEHIKASSYQISPKG